MMGGRIVMKQLPRELALPCCQSPGAGKILVRRLPFDALMKAYRTVGRAAVNAALAEMGVTPRR
jgi:hypothetical protein